MSTILKLVSSIPFLLLAVALLFGGAVAAVYPIANYIANVSVSTTNNFYLIGALMLLLVLAALAEALLLVRLVWGKEAVAAVPRKKGADVGIEAEVRSLKATFTKKALIFFVALATNIFILDQLGGGVLVTRTRHNHLLTQLRSEDGAARKEAAEAAIQLVGDKEIAEALGQVIEKPGASREWLAWAAGVRDDTILKDKLAELMRTGSSRERAAAALSLARMRDGRLLRLAIDAFPHAGDDKRDILIAVGMLGKDKEVTGEADLTETGKFIAGMLEKDELDNEATLVAVWALGRLEAPEALPYLKQLVAPDVGIEAKCIGLEALGTIGAAESSDWLVAMIDKADKQARCPEVVSRDFTGHEVLLCGGMDLVQRILQEIAHIGDRQARKAMERLAGDESHSKAVRQMAKDIAFQMRYVPVNTQ